jgi:conjugative relaxase-like TrwC/TraI family protein
MLCAQASLRRQWGEADLSRVRGAMLDYKPLDPTRLASCWLAKVASGIEDYYAGEGEAQGEWHGRGAAALGLRGEGEDLTAVLRSEYGELRSMSGRIGPGHSPYGMGRKGVRRRPGWDFQMKAPKSVSLIYAFGDSRARREVVAAHDAAIKAAIDYAERHMTWTRRSIDGERREVRGSGLVCALFRHRLSRAGDPQLHTHVLIANATRDERGRWLRLNAPRLLGPSKTLGYLYQAKLRAELTRRLGVEWGPVRRGYADVKWISREAIEAFSRRRREILALLDARGQSPGDAKAAQRAAYDTRRAKERALAPRELRERWRAYGRRVGLEQGEIEAALGRSLTARPGSRAELRRIARELSVGQGIVARRSSATGDEVVREVCERLRGRRGDQGLRRGRRRLGRGGKARPPRAPRAHHRASPRGRPLHDLEAARRRARELLCVTPSMEGVGQRAAARGTPTRADAASAAGETSTGARVRTP